MNINTTGKNITNTLRAQKPEIDVSMDRLTDQRIQEEPVDFILDISLDRIIDQRIPDKFVEIGPYAAYYDVDWDTKYALKQIEKDGCDPDPADDGPEVDIINRER